MKTTNNAQKTENGLVKKSVLRGSAVIVSLVLISWTVGAQNFWDQVMTGYNYGKMAMTKVENSNKTNGSDENDIQFELETQANNLIEITFEAIEAELELQVEVYDANEFVEAELTAETENRMNSYEETCDEVMDQALKLQVEVYDPAKFVEAEIALEIESWMTEQEIIKSVEVFTAKGAVREIEKYAQKQIELQTKTQE
ncbi:MAG TPA: hypothetical protein DCR40_18235 [Prolixibacteraceae bacterium]|nr:hypothetical protein [Prolixibacteraceae bacterium]